MTRLGGPRLSRIRTGKRDRRLGVNVTADQEAALFEQAKDAGLTLPSYLYTQLSHIAVHGPVVNAEGRPAEEQGENTTG